MRIHALLARKIRTGEEENTEILVVSIYCERARNGGGQYTKRILPAFVIPRCNITLENVLCYVSQHTESEEIDYEEASYFLGSYDSRTIRRHIQGAWRIIGELRLRLSKRLTDLGSSAGPTEAEAPFGAWQQLGVLLERFSKVAGGDADGEAGALEPILAIHLVYVELGSGRVPEAGTTLSRDGGPPVPRDTS